jgi:predicted  nucleic acid-binding Zn-ribbon protein
MTNELFQHLDTLIDLDTLVAENKALTIKLQIAETEIVSLAERLADARNEITRLGMVIKRQWNDSETIRRHGRQI